MDFQKGASFPEGPRKKEQPTRRQILGNIARAGSAVLLGTSEMAHAQANESERSEFDALAHTLAQEINADLGVDTDEDGTNGGPISITIRADRNTAGLFTVLVLGRHAELSLFGVRADELRSETLDEKVRNLMRANGYTFRSENLLPPP